MLKKLKKLLSSIDDDEKQMMIADALLFLAFAIMAVAAIFATRIN